MGRQQNKNEWRTQINTVGLPVFADYSKKHPNVEMEHACHYLKEMSK